MGVTRAYFQSSKTRPNLSEKLRITVSVLTMDGSANSSNNYNQY